MTPPTPTAPGVTFTVGEFSRVTYLSVKTLHHYHEIGLLPPASVDPVNGYRRYSVAQVPTAQLIRRLRDLAMPIDDVRAVLDAPDPAARDEAITSHLRRMEEQLDATRATVSSLRTLLEHRSTPGTVAFRREPACAALAVSGTVTFDAVEAWLDVAYDELHDAVAAVGITSGGPDGALYHDELFHRGEGLVVAFVPFGDAATATGPSRGRATTTRLPATTLAVSVHEGPFADLDQAYAALGADLAARGMATTGPVREHYLDTGNDEILRTEVCFPVAGPVPAPGGSSDPAEGDRR